MPERRREREPRSVGELLPTLIAGRGWAERISLGRLRDAWPEVVGPHLASRSEPVRLERGTLTVRAESGAWANELTLLAGSLARRAEQFLGDGRVRQVKVSAGAIGRSEGDAGAHS